MSNIEHIRLQIKLKSSILEKRDIRSMKIFDCNWSIRSSVKTSIYVSILKQIIELIFYHHYHVIR